ncbi:MAG: Maf family nucleotide pyrophosphatase [Bacteroidota bacterium]|nr:Maf family nucleotide pyrophosphatase [Bacteroidota bacterium]MDP3144153.1 Maf family nucleotide pyrophosphatase [Bacteroidota bacterium]MDP3558258.1 Maf family nucleotide pyrophosphatase [Bacteroidota bacterium]
MTNSVEEILNEFPYQLILGSASPRRQELLKSLGFEFLSRPIKADESLWPKDLEAQEIPIFLAELKADAYEEELKNNQLLITADTVVWCEGKVFNKPENFAEGKKMLEALSGKMHEVFTAVCLKSANKQTTFYDASKVYFKKLKSDEIDYYLTNYSPYDKAGGYGVQDWIGYIGIEKIDGSFYNVMGLPVKKLFEELIKF